MPVEKSDSEILRELEIKTTQIHTVLLGANGQKGLCQNFEEHKTDDKIFRSTFYKFRLWIIIIVLVLLTACGFTVPEVLKVLAGV
jgi:hypothetical protein